MTFECSVAVIAGGLSFEREVSLRSGQRVADALRERGYRVGQLDADHQLVETLGGLSAGDPEADQGRPAGWGGVQ